ncbi:holin [Thalassobacillus sp. C254]|uniref:holin n=1 Tax=Thalassobacillus sp. C254 TaxID=1225341 RepID=UPI0006D224E4|nr:holin [Thalassobacillus sp. C254]
MVEILAIASLIVPVVTGAVQAVKKSTQIDKRYAPLLAIGIGLALGAAAFPFADATLAERMWAGGISGLASVGLFELGKQQKKGEGVNE